MSFFDIFNRLDPGPMNRIKQIQKQELELRQQASDISGVLAERLGPSDSKWATPIRKYTEFFQCFACNCNLQIKPEQESVACPFCKEQNTVIRVLDESNTLGIWHVKGVSITDSRLTPKPTGNTTDDDGIIDIAYEEIK